MGSRRARGLLGFVSAVIVCRRKEVRADLFYVLAFVPADAPNEFFVITQQQMTAISS